jgi:uncharacterized BrkB/YihY/UPF0761 family membrane protein
MSVRIPWLYRFALLAAAAGCAAFLLAGHIGEDIAAFYFPREYVPVADIYYWTWGIIAVILTAEAFFALGYRYLRRKKKRDTTEV